MFWDNCPSRGCCITGGETIRHDLANINKNVLLKDIATYAHCLPSGGTLFLSGFYETDLEEIKQCCSVNKLRYIGHKEKEKWTAAKFQKDEV